MTHQILNRHGGQKNSAFLQLVIRILMFLLKPPIMVSQWMKTSQHLLVLMLWELKASFLNLYKRSRWWLSVRFKNKPGYNPVLSLVDFFFQQNPLQDLLSSRNIVISNNESTQCIAGHMVYNLAYT